MAKYKISSLLLSVITVCVLTSCSFSDDLADLSDIADTASSTVNVNFTVSTRGEGDTDDTATGEANENDIKGYGTSDESYRVYFFDATDYKYIMSFTNGTLEKTATGSSAQASYTVSGTLSNSEIETLSGHTDGFIVVFIANWDQYPDDADFTSTTTIDDLCSGSSSLKVTNADFTATFTCPTPDNSSEPENPGYSNVYIPFYGVKKISSLSDVTSGNDVSLGKINLLRAMAKVTVVNVTRTQNTRATYYPDLYNVKLVHYNSTGYCAPTGVYTEDNYETDDDVTVDEDDKTYYVEGLHLVDGTNTNGSQSDSGTSAPKDDGPVIDMYSVNDTTWIAYVPEYYNYITDGETYSDVTANSKDTCYVKYNVRCYAGDNDYVDGGYYTNRYSSYNTNTYDATTLSFATYNDKGVLPTNHKRYNIQRNRSYRFNVSLPKIFNLADTSEPDDYDDVGDWYVKKK